MENEKMKKLLEKEQERTKQIVQIENKKLELLERIMQQNARNN
jgi:hypothetical protein